MAFPPLVTQHMLLTTTRSARKEENQQEESRCRRKMVSIDHAAPSRSFLYILNKWPDLNNCKDLRKIYLLSLNINLFRLSQLFRREMNKLNYYNVKTILTLFTQTTLYIILFKGLDYVQITLGIHKFVNIPLRWLTKWTFTFLLWAQ